jgi:hypothetical protein
LALVGSTKVLVCDTFPVAGEIDEIVTPASPVQLIVSIPSSVDASVPECVAGSVVVLFVEGSVFWLAPADGAGSEVGLAPHPVVRTIKRSIVKRPILGTVFKCMIVTTFPPDLHGPRMRGRRYVVVVVAAE